MKKILLGSLLILLLLAAGALGYVYFSLNSLVKKTVERIGPSITKTEVHLASVHLSPFSLSGRLNGLSIGNPEGYQGPFALKLGNISVSVDRATVLHNPVVVRSLEIHDPEILLTGTPSGTNLQQLIQNIRSYASSESAQSGKEETSQKSSSRKFMIRQVVISGITLHVDVSGFGQTIQQTLKIPEIRLANIGTEDHGLSTSEMAQQIITPILNAAIQEGLAVATKQGLKQLQQKGLQQLGNELNKVLPGFFK